MAVVGIKADTNRIHLENHIPLDTPLRVAIDTSSVCNFHCQYCPHGSKDAMQNMPQAIMSAELAKKCIDELRLFPNKIKKLSLSNIGEPLLNKDLPEIADYASSNEVAECLCITTNASLLTPQLAKDLIAAGIVHFDISIYGLNTKTYQKFTGVETNFEALIEHIAYLNSIKSNAKVIVKITDAVCKTEEDRLKFSNIFSPICDTICYEHAVPIWYDLDVCKDNNDRDVYGRNLSQKEICPLPFYTLVVQANGIVTPCSNDWKQGLPIGDARKDSLFEIWNGERLRKLAVCMLKNTCSGISPCNRCGSKDFCAMDNIDPFRFELLERLKNTNP